MVKTHLIAIALATSFMTCSCSKISISQMRCEYLESPISVDTKSPRFNWSFTQHDDFFQKSFVLNIISKDGSYRWNSGEVESPLMFFQTDNLNLEPCSDYRWELEVTGSDGRKIRGESEFSTALFSKSDWIATWISDGESLDERRAPVLRKTFLSPGKPKRARLYISSAAFADIRINGKGISTTALNPGFTAYDKRNLYNSYDVTDLVNEGENVIHAVLGNGFYNVTDPVAVWDFDKAPWRGRARMIAELHIEYDNGRKVIVPTDGSWKASRNGKRYLANIIYSGDYIVADTDSDEALLPGYDDSFWGPAVSVEAPSAILAGQYMPTIGVDRKISPVSVQNYGDTVYVMDFGVNMSGYVSLTLSGKPGTKVHVRHGELLDENGRLDVSHMNEHFRAVADQEFQTDTYELGDSETVFKPLFCYHGFRYAELVSPEPFSVDIPSVKAEFIHTELEAASTFHSSEPDLDSIRAIVNRSFLCNAMGIPTDCPQREKNGWTADAYMSAETGVFNFDAANFYLKYIDDLIDTATDDGRVADIAPTSGWGYGFGPVWDAAIFIIPQTVYDCYGDIRGIHKAVGTCERYLAWIENMEDAEGAITYGLGDWCTYETATPNDFTSTCYYYLMNKILARFETLLGKDATRYEEKSGKLLALLNSPRFFNAEESTYSNGSQCALALALYAGIVPPDMENIVAAKLSDAVRSRDGHLDFGLIGTRTVLRMLTEYGYADQAYEMVMKKDCPSWRHWVLEGYTTSLEQWEPRPGIGLSYNHVFFGDVNAWMINDLAGINYDPEAPGFSHFILKPHFVRGLDRVEASYSSVAGEILSEWERRGRRILLSVTVPAGTSASLILEEGTKELKSGKHNITIWQH